MATLPNESNTGVPDGVILKPSGSITVTQPGVTISGLTINGSVDIRADNVTLINCKINSTSFSGVTIQPDCSGVVVQNCDIDANGGNGIHGNGTFLNNNIFDAENGIAVWGNNTTIQGNYIHDFGGSADAHFDGIQIDGGNSHIVIQNNVVVVDQGQTSAVMIDNYFGPINDILVDHNVLAGGGYTIYVSSQFNSNPVTNVRVTNNHLGEGQYGYTAFTGTNPTYTYNVLDGWAVANSIDDQPSGGTSPPPPPPPTSPPPPPPPPPTTVGVPTDGNDNIVRGSGNDTINALSGDDVVNAGAGNDTIIGGLGKDTLTGGTGNDLFVFRSAAEIGNTYSTRDIITDFTPGQDRIDLSSIDSNSGLTGNNDFIFLAGNGAAFTGRAGELSWATDSGRDRTLVRGDLNGDGVADFTLQLTGVVNLKASDFVGTTTASPPPPPPPPPASPPPPPPPPVTTTINGTQGDNTLTGDSRDNIINGLGGNDTLVGNAGNDTLNGGFGRDVMTGGDGRDTFAFTSAGEIGTTPWTRDIITDFRPDIDRIDLSAIDANSRVEGNQAFSFLTADDASFARTPGQLAWRLDEGANRTIIQGDTNGDGIHDFEIELVGLIQLERADFIL